MSRYRYGEVGAFDDMAETSVAGSSEACPIFLDLLDSPSGGVVLFEELSDSQNYGDAGGDMVEDSLLDSKAMELFACAFMVDPTDNLNYESTPGFSFHPPPSVDSDVSISSRSSAPDQAAVTLVSVVEPPAFGLGEKVAWQANAASVLPHDILSKVPRKRGEGKYFSSGQKYKPCSWEKYIERVNAKVETGKLKVISKRPKRRRQIRDPEGVTDPVVVALQAQAEIYGEHFNAASFWEWP